MLSISNELILFFVNQKLLLAHPIVCKPDKQDLTLNYHHCSSVTYTSLIYSWLQWIEGIYNSSVCSVRKIDSNYKRIFVNCLCIPRKSVAMVTDVQSSYVRCENSVRNLQRSDWVVHFCTKERFIGLFSTSLGTFHTAVTQLIFWATRSFM